MTWKPEASRAYESNSRFRKEFLRNIVIRYANRTEVLARQSIRLRELPAICAVGRNAESDTRARVLRPKAVIIDDKIHLILSLH